jgi:hypothetical protein
VTAAFLAAEKLFDLEAIWQAIEDAPIAETPRILLMSRAADVVRSHMADLLRSGATTIAPSVMAADLAGASPRSRLRSTTSSSPKRASAPPAWPPNCWQPARMASKPSPSSISSIWMAWSGWRRWPMAMAPIPWR